MYLETKLYNYHRDLVGDAAQNTHPIAFEIDGKRIECGIDYRELAYEAKKNGSFWVLPDDRIEFKIVSKFVSDCSAIGSKIRWRIPRNAIAIYC
jgi:hypothetical protein